MVFRSDSPATGTTTQSADPGEAGAAPVSERRSLPWWRMRTWRKDLDLLTRLRDGLKALPDEEPADDQRPTAVDGPDAAVPASAPADAASPASSPPDAPAPGSAPESPVGERPPDEPAPIESAEPLTPEPPPSAEPVTSEPSASEPLPPDRTFAAIKETFALLGAAGDDAAGYFYGWLFLRRPQLRELFPPAMDEQRDRLLMALTRIVDSMSSPEEMASYLAQLGRDHRKYEVDPTMYEAVGDALIATLRAFAGDAFTAEAQEAWTQTYAAASAIMIRGAEEDAATRPASWSAEVVACEERSRGIMVLTVAPEQELPFEPGQHLTVQTPRWPHVWRPYSIACCPRDDGLIRFHVKAVPGGWVSNALVFHTEPGDELLLGPALGTMTLSHAQDRDLLCVAGGTGLSPLKSIVEQVIKQSAAGQRRRISLFYGARRREELYDLHDLWRLADAYDGLRLTPVTSDDPAFDGMQGNVGRVAARYMPHPECEAYVCGPASMVRETRRVLAKAGIPEERIHFDDALLAQRNRVGSGT